MSHKKMPYGAFVFNGKRQPTHRIAYELTYGKIQDGLIACHHCDNPRCCNPRHIYAGTYKSNMEDRSRRNRANFRRGSNRANSKLTEANVEEIHQKYSGGGVTHRMLAAEYGVSAPRIHKILTGKIWKHVKLPVVLAYNLLHQ